MHSACFHEREIPESKILQNTFLGTFGVIILLKKT